MINWLKKILTPVAGVYNQILLVVIGFILVLFYLYRRDKKTKAMALLEAKYTSLLESQKQADVDRKNYEYAVAKIEKPHDDNTGLSEHDLIVERLRRGGQLRNDDIR